VHFARLTNSLPELPDFVKEASTDSCVATDELPSSSFADMINRKFPVHTKAAAFLSYLYFEDQKDKFTKEAAARINSKFGSAAEVWGIRTEISLAKEAMVPAIEKTAACAADYALSAGGKFFFSVATPASVVKSADDLIECRGNFPYEMRKEAATAIMKSAVAFGFDTVDVPEELHRMAGFGLCDKEAAVAELGRRVGYAAGSRSPLAAQMSKLAAELNEAAELTPETMIKVATIVDVVDRELKIAEQYGKSFSFPEDVFFGAFTEKTAAYIRANNVSMITGNSYSLDQLSKAADALKVFGDEFHGDVVRGDGSVDLQKVADVLPTMPRDEAALFDRAMQSVEKVSFDAGKINKKIENTVGNAYGAVTDAVKNPVATATKAYDAVSGAVSGLADASPKKPNISFKTSPSDPIVTPLEPTATPKSSVPKLQAPAALKQTPAKGRLAAPRAGGASNYPATGTISARPSRNARAASTVNGITNYPAGTK